MFGYCAYGWLLSVVLHRYVYSVEAMKRELQAFRIAQAQCYCCSLNHVDADGDEIACDREVMVRCISEWFGSVGNFEKSVQTRVRDALTHCLGTMGFPYSAVVTGSLPVMWAFFDVVAARLHMHDSLGALAHFLFATNTTFVLSLSQIAAILLVIRRLPRCNLFLSQILATAAFLFMVLAIHGSLQICTDHAGFLPGALIWCGAWLAPSMLLWWCAMSRTREPAAVKQRASGHMVGNPTL